MKNRPSLRAFSLLAGLFLLAAPQIGRAQTVGNGAGNLTRVFPLKNAHPSLVAGWFDRERAPRNWLGLYTSFREQPFPLLFSLPVSLPGNVNGPDGLHFPAGISSLVAIDPQDGLYATGTKEGLDALAKMLPSLDVPLRQVEITTRFVRINHADFSALGLLDTSNGEKIAAPDGTNTVLAPLGDFSTRLDQVMARKNNLVMAAPRVIAIDGASAQLLLSSSTPALVAPGGDGQLKPDDIACVSTSIGVKARVWRVSETSCRIGIEPRYGNQVANVEATLRENQPLVMRLGSESGQPLLAVTTFQFVRPVGLAAFVIRSTSTGFSRAR